MDGIYYYFFMRLFISARIAKKLAFRVVKPGNRPIAVIFAIQVFTVVIQVALAGLIGVYRGYGFTAQLLPNYITVYCKNFIMALPVQIFIAGPIARALFHLMFKSE